MDKSELLYLLKRWDFRLQIAKEDEDFCAVNDVKVEIQEQMKKLNAVL